jgi:Alpha amylase, catalytic domain/Carbohydrate-binding module 48 (Isoamylase N-terminal domain)/Secretion system C-terminal sorting domain
MYSKRLLALFLFSTIFHSIRAQVTCEPSFPTVDDNVTIYYNATQGNGALTGVSPVWAHLGVITNLSSGPTDWKHVATTWGTNNAAAMMTNVGPNLWSKTFNIRTFFGIAQNETVLKMAFVFRNANGSIVGRAADGSDMYYDVYPVGGPLQTRFNQPTESFFLKNVGASIAVAAAASLPATLQLFADGNLLNSSLNALSLSGTVQVTAPGLHRVDFVASTATEKDTSTFWYLAPGSIVEQDPAPGTELGINYLPNGDVRLALYAPNKQIVHVIGDFNDWQPGDAHQMRRSIDGKTWWIDLAGLPSGQPVRFQYLVEGALKIADPLSTLVLDPWNDGFIPPLTFPNLPAYPTGKTAGAVSVLQTNQTPFNWQANNYTRPKKTDLVVYELLMRDFISRHDYPTLLDTLNYLDRLGVTAIELMPVNEFDGNINWGYGPAFHKALDKYYGSAEALKTVIDACHQRGIAVILDVVFNQATGASPLAQLYWDSANNRPAANNPWLNPSAPHDFSVFNDFNHESQATKAYVKNCVKYWITEFKVDGFRFDLSKGFTQKNTLGNVNAWGVYDASRVAIWKDYANFIWAIDPGFYVILEHFADNNEEKELAEYGMMLWGNMWRAYKDLSLGYNTTSNLSWVNYKQRGWSVPHLIGYMESHDEDRIGYELKTYANASVPGYNLRTLPIAMPRMEMLNNLFYTVPGPKMLWQFGEFGYDFSINYCPNGTIKDSCRTDPKPIRWDYLNDPYRRHLHDATAALLQLRKSHPVFETTNYQANISSGQVRSIFLNHSDLNVAVFANVGTTATTVSNPAFQHTGFWYEYYSGDTLFVGSGVPTSFTLAPGAYRLYLDKVVALPPYVQLPVTPEPVGALSFFSIQPNPVQDQFFLNFALLENTDIYLEIRDMAGKLLTQQHFDNMPEGPQQVAIQASDWQPGIYFAVLRDAKGGVSTRKLVRI